MLSDAARRRYARHLVLPEIGESGQRRLLESRVAVVGAGGLGTAALAYLAAGGVGGLRIIEPDRVELSNLQRQILFEEADIGAPKAKAAAARLEEMNKECSVDIAEERLDENNARVLIKDYNLVIDASDNFATRFALSDACMALHKPLISAAISGMLGQISCFKPYLGAPHPCYRCLVAEAPPREKTCEQEGMLGPLAGVMGSLQALEAMRELLGLAPSLSGRLLCLDARTMESKTTLLPRDPNCAFCTEKNADPRSLTPDP